MIDFKKLIAGPIILISLFASFEWTALTLSPSTNFFRYHSIDVASVDNSVSEIKLVSSLERFRLVNMHYQDTLFCKSEKDREYFFYSSQESEYKNAPRSHGIKRSPWVYAARIPKKQSKCFIRSAVSVTLRYGISPPAQIIETKIFEIGN